MLPKKIVTAIEKNKMDMIKTLQEVISFESVSTSSPEGTYPYGKACADALDYMLGKAESIGLKTKNYDYHVGTADWEMNEESFLGILCHLDVVPAIAENWKSNPFKAEIRNNIIYGRGAIDDKGPAVATLYALKAIKDAGYSLRKNVRFLMGCNEENGSSDLVYYNQRDKMPPYVFTPDGSYPIIAIEKGMMRIQFRKDTDLSITLKAGTVPNAVPALAEAVISDEITITETLSVNIQKENDKIKVLYTGKAAHASTPEDGDNAITGILQILSEIPDFKALSDCFPHGVTDGSGLGVACKDKTSGDLTCVCSILNIEKGRIFGVIDIRYPTCTTKEVIFEKVSEAMGQYGFKCTVDIQNNPHCVSHDSNLVKVLKRVYEDETGEQGECLAIGGGTYVHDIEGGVAFGAEFHDWDYNMHGDDENIPVYHLMKTTKMIADAIIQLCDGYVQN